MPIPLGVGLAHGGRSIWQQMLQVPLVLQVRALLGPQGQLVLRDQQEHLGQLALLVPQGQLVLRDQQEHLGQLALLVPQGLQELLVRQQLYTVWPQQPQIILIYRRALQVNALVARLVVLSDLILLLVMVKFIVQV
ncbi:MAG: hypothetical protein EBT77_01485 [Verrucomicrobia bacterium]|nr:hypothetical protein [Verrucomicrobiota bacterium]